MLSFLVLGLIAGLMSGLLGIGGGVVLVPALVILAKLGIKEAIGVSLAVIVPTAFAGFLKHYHAGSVNLQLAALVAVGGVVGALLGASVAHFLPAALLKKIFGCFLIVVGLNILFGWTSGMAARFAEKVDAEQTSSA